ncbi:MAG: hypothetical protein LBU32_15290 [Clostridiales bacterium]|jgi:hypothetical protein|nr:hypothetical protein [Clostridiales bacterium]
MEIFGPGAPFKRAAGILNGRKAQLCVFIRLAAPVNAARSNSRLSAACKGRFADRGGGGASIFLCSLPKIGL